MKIAFYLDNRNIPDVDLSRPRLGNPGCGNSEYRLAAFPSYLATAEGHGYKPVILANHIGRLPDNVPCLRAVDILEAARRAKDEGCDFFVYRPWRRPQAEFLGIIDRLQLSVVPWPGIALTDRHLRAMAGSPQVKAVVCVEREQHDLMWDTPVWPKLTCIPNSLDVDGFRLVDPPATESNLVVYLGALVPQKGFHVLAKAWPRILRRHPEAHLAVIGSAALYDTAAGLGPWGIAEPTYEAQFAPFLAGPDGRPHPSVSFLGKLGLEKKEWLYRASVGVPNPSGQTESYCMSAVEFQACGAAVVSAARYGLLDTVRHGRTGLLGRTVDDLVENICGLLEDPARAEALGRNGVDFVRERYDSAVVIAAWHDLFDRLARGTPPRKFFLKRNLHRHAKALILVNRILQMTLGRVVAWPSVVEMKTRIAKLRGFRTLMTLKSR